LRDYGSDDQIGHEPTPVEYVEELLSVFAEVRRVLRDDGTLWINLGDCYEDKNVVGIPWRVAFALQDAGWCLRSDIVWHKPNPMPEPVTDRPTKAHEYLFLLSKGPRYFYDHEAIQEPATGKKSGNIERLLGIDCDRPGSERGRGIPWSGSEFRNKRSVWTIPTQPFHGAHFAVMPEALVEPCVLAGSRPGDLVLDPFAGAGTVLLVATKNDRRSIGMELSPEFRDIARSRILEWENTDEARQGSLGI
jgi:DNA modification methylase